MLKKIAATLIICLYISYGFAQKNLDSWLSAVVSERKPLESLDFAKKKLSKKESEETKAKLVVLWSQELKRQTKSFWDNNMVLHNDLKMKFQYKTFGNSPADGRSLYISLHGGGSAPSAVNDQQYHNQIKLYKPEEGVYLAPRAPWDDWDMWFKPDIDTLFDILIRAAVAHEGVNPNKIYLMGYSAGGDGLYRLAPRMADRWAAASMMAGHPGDVSFVNLRNLPFMIWMGELDKAYDRNKHAVLSGNILDSLQKADPKGYIHETHIVKNKGHWMDAVDTVAVGWMAKYRRNPYPDKIVWKQGDRMHKAFYWVSVPPEQAEKGKELRLSRIENKIVVEKSDYDTITIYLNDEMFNLDKPVSVEYHGRVIYQKKVSRQLAVMEETWNIWYDQDKIYPAKIELKLQR